MAGFPCAVAALFFRKNFIMGLLLVVIPKALGIGLKTIR